MLGEGDVDVEVRVVENQVIEVIDCRSTVLARRPHGMYNYFERRFWNSFIAAVDVRIVCR